MVVMKNKTTMTAPSTSKGGNNGMQLDTCSMVGSRGGEMGVETSSQMKGPSPTPLRRRRSPLAAGRYLAAASSLEPEGTQDEQGAPPQGSNISMRDGDRETISKQELSGLLLVSPPSLRKKNMSEPAEEVKSKPPPSHTRGVHARRGSFNSESGSQTADTSVASGSGTATTTPTDPKPAPDGSLPPSPSRQRHSICSVHSKSANFLSSAEKRRRTWEEQRQVENVVESLPRNSGIINGKHPSPTRSSVLAATKRWVGETSEGSYCRPKVAQLGETNASVTRDGNVVRSTTHAPSTTGENKWSRAGRSSLSLRRAAGDFPCTNAATDEPPSQNSPLHMNTGHGAVVEEDLACLRQRQWTDTERAGTTEREDATSSPRSHTRPNTLRTTNSPDHPRSPSLTRSSSAASSSGARHHSRIEVTPVSSSQREPIGLGNSFNRTLQDRAAAVPSQPSEPEAWKKALRKSAEGSTQSPSNRQTPRATSQGDSLIYGKSIMRQSSTTPDLKESRPRLQIQGLPFDAGNNFDALDVDDETAAKTTADIHASPLTSSHANDAATTSGISGVYSRPRGDRIRHLRTLFETKDSDDSRSSSMRLSRQTKRGGGNTRSRSVGAISRRSGSRGSRELSLEMIGQSDDQHSLSGKSLSGKSLSSPYVEKLRALNRTGTDYYSLEYRNETRKHAIPPMVSDEKRAHPHETTCDSNTLTEEIFVKSRQTDEGKPAPIPAMQPARSFHDEFVPANAPGVKRLRSMFEQAKNASATGSLEESDSRGDRPEPKTVGSVGGQRIMGDYPVHRRGSSDLDKIGVVTVVKSDAKVQTRLQTDSTPPQKYCVPTERTSPPVVINHSTKTPRNAGCLRPGSKFLENDFSAPTRTVAQRRPKEEDKTPIPLIPGLYDDVKPAQERQSVAYQVALRESAGSHKLVATRASPTKATTSPAAEDFEVNARGFPRVASLRRTSVSREHQDYGRQEPSRTPEAVQPFTTRGSPDRSPGDPNNSRHARRRRRSPSKDEGVAESLAREYEDPTGEVDLKPSGSNEAKDRDVAVKSPTRQIGYSTPSVRALIASVERAPMLKGTSSRTPQSAPRDAVITLKAAADRLARRATPKLQAKTNDHPEPNMSPRSGLSTSRHGNTVSSDAAAVFDLKGGGQEESPSPRSKSGNALLASPSRRRSSSSGYAMWNDYGPRKSMGQRNSVEKAEHGTKEEHRFPIGLQQSNQERDLRAGGSATDSDDEEDGVTLSPTISDVSGITNPSGIESTTRRNVEDDVDSSCDISSIGDEEAGHPKKRHPAPSEASSSQASEAAAPLIRSALGGSPRGRSCSSSGSEVVDFANIDESGEVKRIRLLSRRQNDHGSFLNGHQQDYVEVVISGSISGSMSQSSTDSLFLLDDERLQQTGPRTLPRDNEWDDENIHTALTTQKKKPFSWYMDSIDALMDAIKGGESNGRRIGRQYSAHDMTRALESSRRSEPLKAEKPPEEIGLFEEIQSGIEKKDRPRHRRNRSQGPSRRSKIMGLMRRRKMNDNGQVRDAGTCS